MKPKPLDPQQRRAFAADVIKLMSEGSYSQPSKRQRRAADHVALVHDRITRNLNNPAWLALNRLRSEHVPVISISGPFTLQTTSYSLEAAMKRCEVTDVLH